MSNSDNADTVLVVDLDPENNPQVAGRHFLAKKHCGSTHLDYEGFNKRQDPNLKRFLDKIFDRLSRDSFIGVVVAKPFDLTDEDAKLVDEAARCWEVQLGHKVKLVWVGQC